MKKFSQHMALLFVFLNLLVTATLHAATSDPYMDPSLEDERKPSYGVDDVSSVDAFSGRISLHHTDISLNGVGPQVSVTRLYRSSQNMPGIVNAPVLDYRGEFGFGWDIHFGRVLTKKFPTSTTCGEQTTYTDDNPSLELSDGSRQRFYTPLSGSGVPHHMISDHAWVMDCGVTNGKPYFLVTDGNGTKYTFDFRGVYRTAESIYLEEQVSYAWYLTRAEDLNGNYVVYEYTNKDGLDIPLSVNASDGRFILFNYRDATPNIITITSGYGPSVREEWQYNFEQITAPSLITRGIRKLVSVSGPEGLNWIYSYNTDGIGIYNLSSMTFPYGGVESFTYTQRTLPAVPGARLSPDTVAVYTRKNSGPAIEPETWTYFYSSDNSGWIDFTTIKNSKFEERQYFCGSRSLSAFSKPEEIDAIPCTHIIGTMFKDEIYEKEKLLQTTFYEWVAGAGSDQRDKYFGSEAYWGQPAFHLLLMKTVNRGERFYMTSYRGYTYPWITPTETLECADNRQWNSNDLLSIDPNFCKGERTEYIQNNDLWVQKAHRTTQAVTLHTNFTDSATSTRTGHTSTKTFDFYSFKNGKTVSYDGNWNVLTEASGGTTKTYTRNTDGTIESATDWSNEGYKKYEDYTDGIPTKITNLNDNTFIQRNVFQGLITSYTDEEKNSVGYEYDGLGRIAHIETPRSDDADIDIDHSFLLRKMTKTRGNLIQEDSFDGFGRKISSYNGKATTRFKYDSLGRLYFKSFPNSDHGMLSEIDVLGRIVTTTNTQDNSYTTHAYDDKDDYVTITDANHISTIVHHKRYGDPDENRPDNIVSAEGIITKIKYYPGGPIYRIDQGDDYHGFLYDEEGRLAASIDKTLIKYNAFDDRGNLKSTSYDNIELNDAGDLVFSPVVMKESTFNEKNLPSSVKISGDSSASFDYYKNGQKKGEYKYFAGALDAERTYIFDENGNIRLEKLQDQIGIFSAEYSYDALDHLDTIKYPFGDIVSLHPNQLGKPTAIGEYVSEIEYFDNGLISSISYANGKNAIYSQSPLNPYYISGLSVNDAVDVTFDHDNVGNITHIYDNLIPKYQEADIGLDKDYRLRSAIGVWGELSYTYDETNNFKTKTINGNIDSYEYTDNKLSMINRQLNDGWSYSIPFYHDKAGNVTQDGKAEYSYSGLGELLEATDFHYYPNKKTKYFTDGSGNRYKTINQDGSINTSFYNTQGRLLLEANASTSKVTQYYYLGNMLIASREKDFSSSSSISVNEAVKNSDGSVNLSWSDSLGDGALYQVQSSSSSTFASYNVEYTGSDKSVTLPADFEFTGNAYFRVVKCSYGVCSSPQNAPNTVSVQGIPKEFLNLVVDGESITAKYSVSSKQYSFETVAGKEYRILMQTPYYNYPPAHATVFDKDGQALELCNEMELEPNNTCVFIATKTGTSKLVVSPPAEIAGDITIKATSGIGGTVNLNGAPVSQDVPYARDVIYSLNVPNSGVISFTYVGGYALFLFNAEGKLVDSCWWASPCDVNFAKEGTYTADIITDGSPAASLKAIVVKNGILTGDETVPTPFKADYPGQKIFIATNMVEGKTYNISFVDQYGKPKDSLPDISVYDPNGNPLVSFPTLALNAQGTIYNASNFGFNALLTGKHTIVVTPHTQDQIGSATLTISEELLALNGKPAIFALSPNERGYKNIEAVTGNHYRIYFDDDVNLGYEYLEITQVKDLTTGITYGSCFGLVCEIFLPETTPKETHTIQISYNQYTIPSYINVAKSANLAVSAFNLDNGVNLTPDAGPLSVNTQGNLYGKRRAFKFNATAGSTYSFFAPQSEQVDKLSFAGDVSSNFLTSAAYPIGKFEELYTNASGAVSLVQTDSNLSAGAQYNVILSSSNPVALDWNKSYSKTLNPKIVNTYSYKLPLGQSATFTIRATNALTQPVALNNGIYTAVSYPFDSTPIFDKSCTASPDNLLMTCTITHTKAGNPDGEFHILVAATNPDVTTLVIQSTKEEYVDMVTSGGFSEFNASTAGQTGRFTFTIASSQANSLVWAGNSFTGSLTFDIYNPTTGTKVKSYTVTTKDGVIDLSGVLAAGKYQLLITSSNSGLGKVSVALSNNQVFTGTVNASTKNITLAAGTVYNYKFASTNGSFLGLGLSIVSSTPSGGALNLEVLDTKGVIITTCKITVTLSSTCDLAINADGTYVARIYATTPTSMNFNLTVSSDVVAATTIGQGSQFTATKEGQNQRITFPVVTGKNYSLMWSGSTFASGSLYIYSADGVRRKTVAVTTNAGITTVGTISANGVYTAMFSPDSSTSGSIGLGVKETALSPLSGASAAVNLTLDTAKFSMINLSGKAGTGYNLSMFNVVPSITGGTVKYTVIDPAGAKISTCVDVIAKSTLPAACHIVTPTTGTYTVLVQPSGNYSATASLAYSQDVTETLVFPTLSKTTTVAYEGQNIRYTFAGTVGGNYRVSWSASTLAGNYSRMSVTGPDGASLGYVDFNEKSGTNTGAIYLNTVAQAGNYVVSLVPYPSAKGTLTFNLESFALPNLQLDKSIPASINGGVATTFMYTAAASEKLGFAISSINSTASDLVLTYSFLQPDGTVIATCSAQTATTAVPSSCDVKTAVAGVHKVVITPSKNVAATAVVTLTKDKAYTIASDGTVTNFASTLPGKNANIVFPATAGTTYTLKLSGSTFPGSNPVVVKDTSLKAVATGTFGNTSSSSTILVTFTAAKTGNYTITLSPAGDAIGSVDFKVVVGSTAANDSFYNKQVIAMADRRPPLGLLVRPFSSLIPSSATAI